MYMLLTSLKTFCVDGISVLLIFFIYGASSL